MFGNSPPICRLALDLSLSPNARLQALGIAGAKNERRLFPVACKPLFGPAAPPTPGLLCPGVMGVGHHDEGHHDEGSDKFFPHGFLPMPDAFRHLLSTILVKPNARPQARRAAGAQRTLEAVACRPWFGWNALTPRR